MITMDSANMHLASLTNTNVISIWGSTHPCLGFGPLNNGEYVIKAFEDEELNRPLSVYGKVNKQDLKSKHALNFHNQQSHLIKYFLFHQKYKLTANL